MCKKNLKNFAKTVDKHNKHWYNIDIIKQNKVYGGIKNVKIQES